MLILPKQNIWNLHGGAPDGRAHHRVATHERTVQAQNLSRATMPLLLLKDKSWKDVVKLRQMCQYF
jgi:hypothetical protein